MLQGKRILIVDDEADLREVICSRFQMEGSEVVLAENGIDAIDRMRRSGFDVVISDIRMPGGDGIELLDLIKQLETPPKVVLISGFADLSSKDIIARGASALLIKPFDLDDILNAVCEALEK